MDVIEQARALLQAERDRIDEMLRALGGKRRGRPPKVATPAQLSNGRRRKIHIVGEREPAKVAVTKKRKKVVWTPAMREAKRKLAKKMWREGKFAGRTGPKRAAAK